MTNHYYQHPIALLHYYKFGNGPKAMLCFHGYGMHGKQFKLLEEPLGSDYTFYGFDLFFHKETKLRQQDLASIKQGITKVQLAKLFTDFCDEQQIHKFSILSYSMGSHYAATIVEEAPERILEFIAAAPSSFKPGWLVIFLSRKKLGNKLLEKLALSDKGMHQLLKFIKSLKVIDQKIYEILYQEIATYELRFSFYACLTYLKHLKMNHDKLVQNLNQHQIKSIFIFGARDKNYSVKIAEATLKRIHLAKQEILDANHELVNAEFPHHLKKLLHDN
ncbi:dihydrolipoyllysine-residue acetyltransferase component of acetoin cleaving system [Pedobacter glucosidilyticus]|nr:alpha/beta hydrolase [Pedobacter glucosidilyticus]KHJ38583.1 dihydrolipoyllysine-residue acetyltransferase component of acetoin cleaving system [Pedobacter glucosidilyticus]